MKRYIKCITRGMSEAKMLHVWFENKKKILDILLVAREMSSEPHLVDNEYVDILFKIDIDPHKLSLTQRTHSRKGGRMLTEEDERMLAFVSG